MARVYNNTELSFLGIDPKPPCINVSTTFAGHTSTNTQAMGERKAKFMLSLRQLSACEAIFHLKDLCYGALRHEAVYHTDPKMRWLYNELQTSWDAVKLGTDDLTIEQYGLRVWRKPVERESSKDLFVISSQAPLSLAQPSDGNGDWSVLKDHLFDFIVDHKAMLLTTGLNTDKLDSICGQLQINAKEPFGTIDAEYNLVIKGTVHLGLYPHARISV